MFAIYKITEFINYEFALRLLVAGALGVAVGLEREYRAKEAGYRTHFLVCVGSALMMLISKYAFWDLMSSDFIGVGNEVVNSERISTALSVDPARIAAGVVSGVGFLGAGTIIIHRQIVKGLTTAAGIWATSGIGLAVGAGMYWESIITTILVLIGLELLSIIFGGLSIKSMNIEFELNNKDSLNKVEELFSDEKYIVVSYIIQEREKNGAEYVFVESSLKIRKRAYEKDLFAKLSSIDGLIIHKVE